MCVIDNGSGMLCAGFAGDEAPRSVFPSLIGRPCYPEAIEGGRPRDFYVGDEACAKAGMLTLTYPIERGIITNWDDMEKVWHHTFSDELRVDPSDRTVLIMDHYNEMAINKSQREKTMEVMFETFSVPSFSVHSSSVSALYSSGRTTGISIDCGHGVTEISCIWEGRLIPKSAFSIAIGGFDVTNYLQKCLNERGYTFRTSADKEIVRDMKEKLGYVALDFEAEMKKTGGPNKSYVMPDGEVVNIGSERFRCTQLMFNPRLDYFEYDGIHRVIYDAIMNCKVDLRKDLFANIVLSGGNSMVKGFPERLEKEIVRLAPKGMKVRIFAFPEHENAVWIGGSILASLSDFPKIVVTRSEYKEVGPRIVHEKCPR